MGQRYRYESAARYRCRHFLCQGVFVDFFGIPACTASGLARIALRTDAAVVPGFTVWDAKLRKYILRFDPAVELIHTGDNEADIVANTAKFTKVVEDFIRRYPDQWLWVHRRWKTRPPGQPPLYSVRGVTGASPVQAERSSAATARGEGVRVVHTRPRKRQ